MHAARGRARSALSRTGALLARLFDGLARVLSLTYATLIGAAIVFVAGLYAGVLRPLLAANLSASALVAHTTASVALLLSAAVNYAAVVTTPAGSPSETLSPADPTGHAAVPLHLDTGARTSSETWRHCKVCRAPKPPRAHHCSTCGVCVLRMCHHCPAVARCVGLRNYGWYFRFITVACAGCVYLAGTCMWLQKTAGRSLSSNMADVVFLSMLISMAVAVAVGVLSVWHTYLILTGQTTIECYENWAVHRRGDAPPSWTRWGGPFDAGLKCNVRDAFGDPPATWLPWWTVLVLPASRRLSNEVEML